MGHYVRGDVMKYINSVECDPFDRRVTMATVNAGAKLARMVAAAGFMWEDGNVTVHPADNSIGTPDIVLCWTSVRETA